MQVVSRSYQQYHVRPMSPSGRAGIGREERILAERPGERMERIIRQAPGMHEQVNSYDKTYSNLWFTSSNWSIIDKDSNLKSL